MGMAIHVVINTITINHHHHQALLLVLILLRILLSFHTSFPFLSFPFLSFLHALPLPRPRPRPRPPHHNIKSINHRPSQDHDHGLYDNTTTTTTTTTGKATRKPKEKVLRRNVNCAWEWDEMGWERNAWLGPVMVERGPCSLAPSDASWDSRAKKLDDLPNNVGEGPLAAKGGRGGGGGGESMILFCLVLCFSVQMDPREGSILVDKSLTRLMQPMTFTRVPCSFPRPSTQPAACVTQQESLSKG